MKKIILTLLLTLSGAMAQAISIDWADGTKSYVDTLEAVVIRSTKTGKSVRVTPGKKDSVTRLAPTTEYDTVDGKQKGGTMVMRPKKFLSAEFSESRAKTYNFPDSMVVRLSKGRTSRNCSDAEFEYWAKLKFVAEAGK